VPESLISQGEDGSYFINIMGKQEGPFETEEDLCLWLVNNRTKTINAGIMSSYKTPDQYTTLITDSLEDIKKIVQALVEGAIPFQYVPPEIDKMFVYMVMIKREDRKAAEHALEMIR
jgi:hypothetical protein